MKRSAFTESAPMNGNPRNSVLDLPGPHILVDDRGEDVLGVEAAARALWIRVLDERDRGVGSAEHAIVLGDPGEVDDRRRRAARPARAVVVPQEQRHHHERAGGGCTATAKAMKIARRDGGCPDRGRVAISPKSA